MAKYIESIPYFISDKTKDGLVEKMLKNNIENNQIFQYENIMFANGEFVVWFAVPMKTVLAATRLDISAKDKIKNTTVKNKNKVKIQKAK